jgi:hypothetical protein
MQCRETGSGKACYKVFVPHTRPFARACHDRPQSENWAHGAKILVLVEDSLDDYFRHLFFDA